MCVCVCILQFWTSKHIDLHQDKGAYEKSFPFLAKFFYYLPLMGTLLEQI